MLYKASPRLCLICRRYAPTESSRMIPIEVRQSSIITHLTKAQMKRRKRVLKHWGQHTLQSTYSQFFIGQNGFQSMRMAMKASIQRPTTIYWNEELLFNQIFTITKIPILTSISTLIHIQKHLQSRILRGIIS